MGTYTVGIDLGSTTAKLVALDADENVVFSIYRRHHAETRATLQSILVELENILGNARIAVMFTDLPGWGQ